MSKNLEPRRRDAPNERKRSKNTPDSPYGVFFCAPLQDIPSPLECRKAVLRKKGYTRKCWPKSVILTWPSPAVQNRLLHRFRRDTPVHSYAHAWIDRLGTTGIPDWSRANKAPHRVRNCEAPCVFAGPTWISDDCGDSLRRFLSRPAPDTGGPVSTARKSKPRLMQPHPPVRRSSLLESRLRVCGPGHQLRFDVGRCDSRPGCFGLTRIEEINATVDLMVSPRRYATHSFCVATGEFERHIYRFPVISNLFANTPSMDR
jgi:hypothetical protein